MAEFQWWLLLVGLVAGGGLVAVVFLDGARREQDVEDAEIPAEAQWIAARLASGARRRRRGPRRGSAAASGASTRTRWRQSSASTASTGRCHRPIASIRSTHRR